MIVVEVQYFLWLYSSSFNTAVIVLLVVLCTVTVGVMVPVEVVVLFQFVNQFYGRHKVNRKSH